MAALVIATSVAEEGLDFPVCIYQALHTLNILIGNVGM